MHTVVRKTAHWVWSGANMSTRTTHFHCLAQTIRKLWEMWERDQEGYFLEGQRRDMSKLLCALWAQYLQCHYCLVCLYLPSCQVRGEEDKYSLCALTLRPDLHFLTFLIPSVEAVLTQALASNTLAVASDTLSTATEERRVMVSWECVFIIYKSWRSCTSTTWVPGCLSDYTSLYTIQFSRAEWIDFIRNAPSINMSSRGDMSENSLTWFADAKAWCNYWPRVIDWASFINIANTRNSE